MITLFLAYVCEWHVYVKLWYQKRAIIFNSLTVRDRMRAGETHRWGGTWYWQAGTTVSSCYNYVTIILLLLIKSKPPRILIHAYQTCFIFTIPPQVASDESPTVAIEREQTGKPQQADVACFVVQRLCLLCLLWQDFTPICFVPFFVFWCKTQCKPGQTAVNDDRLPMWFFIWSFLLNCHCTTITTNSSA